MQRGADCAVGMGDVSVDSEVVMTEDKTKILESVNRVDQEDEGRRGRRKQATKEREREETKRWRFAFLALEF